MTRAEDRLDSQVKLKMTKEKRCHPELVSGSHYSIYPLVFVCKIYEMPKQVRHDSLVRGRGTVWCGFGVTKEERVSPLSSLRGLGKPKQ